MADQMSDVGFAAGEKVIDAQNVSAILDKPIAEV